MWIMQNMWWIAVMVLVVVMIAMVWAFFRIKKKAAAQMIIINTLQNHDGYMDGKEIQALLEKHGVNMTALSFYELCAEMEELGCIDRNIQEKIDSSTNTQLKTHRLKINPEWAKKEC